MSSFFSTRTKSQVRRNSSSSKDTTRDGHGGGEADVLEIKSSLSRMRKKNKPKPITISLENGNLILTGATTNPQIVYADSPWSPTTPTLPNAASYSAPWHHDSAIPPSPWPTQFHAQYPWSPESVGPGPQIATHAPRDWPLPELPGTISNPNLVELEAPTTPAVRRDDEVVPEPPPDLTPSGSRNTRSTNPPEPENGPQSPEEARNSEKQSVSTTVAQRSDDAIQPQLDNTNSCWTRALRMEGTRLLGKRSMSKSPFNRSVKKDKRGSLKKKNIEELQADYDLRLKSKDEEVSGLVDLHRFQIDTFCNFVLEHVPEIHKLCDTTAKETIDIIKEHQSHQTGPSDPDKLHMSQNQQIRELKSQVVHLERRVSRYERLTKKYRSQVKKLKGDAEQSTRREESLAGELQEKDAQVAALNTKIVQLLTLDDPSPYPRPLFSHDFEEKDLPAPKQCDEQRTWEPKLQTTSLSSSIHRDGGMIGKLQFEGEGGPPFTS